MKPKPGQKVIIRKAATKSKQTKRLLPIEGEVLSVEKKEATIITRRGLFQCPIKCVKKAKQKKPKSVQSAESIFFQTPLGRDLLECCRDPMERNRLEAAFEAGWKMRGGDRPA